MIILKEINFMNNVPIKDELTEFILYSIFNSKEKNKRVKP